MHRSSNVGVHQRKDSKTRISTFMSLAGQANSSSDPSVGFHISGLQYYDMKYPVSKKDSAGVFYRNYDVDIGINLIEIFSTHDITNDPLVLSVKVTNSDTSSNKNIVRMYGQKFVPITCISSSEGPAFKSEWADRNGPWDGRVGFCSKWAPLSHFSYNFTDGDVPADNHMDLSAVIYRIDAISADMVGRKLISSEDGYTSGILYTTLTRN